MTPLYARLADARHDAETGYHEAPKGVILCDNHRCDNTAPRNGELCDECKGENEEHAND